MPTFENKYDFGPLMCYPVCLVPLYCFQLKALSIRNTVQYIGMILGMLSNGRGRGWSEVGWQAAVVLRQIRFLQGP